MEDIAIINLFFSRNQDAIRETDRKYGKKLMRLSVNITGSHLDSEECVNDTYLAAWEQIPPTKPENFGAYLCRIVRNLSCKVFRRSKAQKRNADIVSLTDELCEVIPDPGVCQTGEEELGKAIDAFLESLDEDTQLLFIRRYFYSDSLAFIASLTGMSENSIATRLFRARNKLKKYLGKEGYSI